MRACVTAVAAIFTAVCLLCAPAAVHGQNAPAGAPAPSGLPEVIPIFPLPDAGLFPNASHDFHIFEPRYRAMIADALKGDRIIGMVMLQPGYEADYEGRPPIFPIGCAGLITRAELLPDGRYNITLGGLVKFRVTGEDQGKPYRLAHVTPSSEPLTSQQVTSLHDERERIEQLLRALADEIGLVQLLPGVPDEQVVDELAEELPMPKPVRYELLVKQNPLERGRAIVDLLEMYLKNLRP